jgi:hypothetical protein
MDNFEIITTMCSRSLTNSMLEQKPVMEETTAEDKVTYSTISYHPDTLYDKTSIHHLCP